MSKVVLAANPLLQPFQGIMTEILLGVVLLALVYYVKRNLVTSTKDFVIANRKIGFGYGVAGLISIWTWAMAVMMSSVWAFVSVTKMSSCVNRLRISFSRPVNAVAKVWVIS